MLHTMIQKSCAKWFSSDECKIKNLISYMISTGELRDAQIEAIKTYLFLKIACDNKPLYELFCNGAFNSLSEEDLNSMELSTLARETLFHNKAALSLYEYATQKNDRGEQVSVKLTDEIKKNPQSIDYEGIFKKIFYGVTYSDYLFSLPMGAGKTFLMAAFIYIDLYFAMQNPAEKRFARNFIILAPSGLKTSVIPSLRTIQEFNPAWVLPEPTASEIKRQMIFEVLDENKSAKKSNLAKNPNVQKLALHQPFEELTGLVAVTNAEKVILDGLVRAEQGELFEESSETKDREANELRYWIGKLPQLSVFIDEVHHATDGDIKLRSVVNRWANGEKKNVTNVIGFSGTPYLDKAEKIPVTDSLSVASSDISNTVYYYPLVDAIGNFLKYPTVKVSDNKDSMQIVESGVREFLQKYKDTIYDRPPRTLQAKLAVYCGKGIDFLEEEVYPFISNLIMEYGLNPNEHILRYHDGNKNHPKPQDSDYQFKILDRSESKIRIILLCQIGKEGWNCRSLAGVILSQEGDCPTNMVLQTSCRCLRQVERGIKETALIYLNDSNAEKLKKQLEQQQHINLDEFQKGSRGATETLNRYNRTEHLKLPPIPLYQYSIKYDTLLVEEPDTDNVISNAVKNSEQKAVINKQFDVRKADFTNIDIDSSEHGKLPARYNTWLYEIARESFGFVTIAKLHEHDKALRKVFNEVSYKADGETYFSSHYDIQKLNSLIRTAFYEKRDFSVREEFIKESVRLLCIEEFSPQVEVESSKIKDYFPEEIEVQKIIDADKSGKTEIDEKTKTAVTALRAAGLNKEADDIENKACPYPNKDRTFHYLPYKTDSSFEQKFLNEVLKEECVSKYNLEVYYNGDRMLTDFRIHCYKKTEKDWANVGEYTPDFIILQRKSENEVGKVLIVETKGSLYANDPNFIARREFVEQYFIKMNNEKTGAEKFSYLYLQDNESDEERIKKTIIHVNAFFGEEM